MVKAKMQARRVASRYTQVQSPFSQQDHLKIRKIKGIKAGDQKDSILKEPMTVASNLAADIVKPVAVSLEAAPAGTALFAGTVGKGLTGTAAAAMTSSVGGALLTAGLPMASGGITIAMTALALNRIDADNALMCMNHFGSEIEAFDKIRTEVQHPLAVATARLDKAEKDFAQADKAVKDLSKKDSYLDQYEHQYHAQSEKIDANSSQDLAFLKQMLARNTAKHEYDEEKKRLPESHVQAKKSAEEARDKAIIELKDAFADFKNKQTILLEAHHELLSAIDARVDTKSSQLDELRTQVRSQQRDLYQTEKSLTATQKPTRALIRGLLNLRTEVNFFPSQADLKKDEVHLAEKGVTKAEKEVEKRKGSLDAEKAKLTTLEKAKKGLEGKDGYFEARNAVLKQESVVKEKRTALKTAQQNLGTAKNNLAEKQEEFSTLHAQESEISDAIATKKQDLSQTTAQLSRITGQHNTLTDTSVRGYIPALSKAQTKARTLPDFPEKHIPFPTEDARFTAPATIEFLDNPLEQLSKPVLNTTHLFTQSTSEYISSAEDSPISPTTSTTSNALSSSTETTINSQHHTDEPAKASNPTPALDRSIKLFKTLQQNYKIPTQLNPKKKIE